MATTSARSIAEASTLTVEGGTKVYSTIEELPFAGNQVGDQAFVTTGNKLYIWTGTQWFNIGVTNEPPVFTITPSTSALIISADALTIDATASDPEGFPVSYSYEVTSGTFANTAIEHTNGVFTITPGSADSDVGVFSVTFKATDGINISEASVEISHINPTDGTGSGWFAGGYTPSYLTTVHRILYSSDTGTAAVRGSLNYTNSGQGATGNAYYGWIGGGYAPRSVVERIDYTNDGVTASIRSPLTLAKRWPGATGNDSYGWFAGGYTPAVISTIERIDYADDLTSPVVRGPLTTATNKLSATSNANYGWFGGGYPAITTVDRIDYVDDSVTALTRGPLSIQRYDFAATGNANYGWFGGRYPALSSVDRIDYADDTSLALVRGPLSYARGYMGAVGDSDYGWFGGGLPAVSTIDRIDYAADTGTAAVRGPLTRLVRDPAATGGYPG